MFWKKRWFWIIVVLAIFAGVCLTVYLSAEPEKDKAYAIGHPSGVKWEYRDTDEVKTTLIPGRELLINTIFHDIYECLVPIDQPESPGSWIHQVSFDCPEPVLNAEPIVFRIYENAIQVDDQWYRFPEAISFTAVLEEAKLWYDYALDKFGTE